jgi:hypothetical protein
VETMFIVSEPTPDFVTVTWPYPSREPCSTQVGPAADRRNGGGGGSGAEIPTMFLAKSLFRTRQPAPSTGLGGRFGASRPRTADTFTDYSQETAIPIVTWLLIWRKQLVVRPRAAWM